MDDDRQFRPRLMTFPGTSRVPFNRPRLPPVTSNVAADALKSSLGSGEIWVVQVSSSAQSTDKRKANGHVSHESLHRTLQEDDKEESLDSIQSEERAVELLSREYDSVLSNTTTATKLASKVHENTSRSGSSESQSPKGHDTMLSGMVPALILGQCFSLLGVNNVTCRNGQKPEFRWLSLRVLFSSVVSLMLAINTIFALIDLLNRNELTLGGSQVVVFYLSSFVASCLYVRLAYQWASLCSAFKTMETRVGFYGNSSGLRQWMKILTAVILILALVEHGLAQLNTFIYMGQTMSSNHSAREWLKYYFDGQFRHVGSFIPFSPLTAAITIAINLTSTFIWNYNDLFIILISVAISWRFRLLNNSLIEKAHENKDVKSWRQARETYNEISTLTRTVDCSLSVHVLLSFVNNFYFICLQLLHTVRHEKNTLHQNIYFAFSFGFLLGRAVAVSLFASSIYEESRAFKRVLFSVPSESYCDEVDRFLVQVTTDDVALTGCNFFNVTRSLLLTVVGTITTYEVVLVQFNGLNSNN